MPLTLLLSVKVAVLIDTKRARARCTRRKHNEEASQGSDRQILQAARAVPQRRQAPLQQRIAIYPRNMRANVNRGHHLTAPREDWHRYRPQSRLELFVHD